MGAVIDLVERLNPTSTPSIAVVPFQVADPRNYNLTVIAGMLHWEVDNIFKKWKWLDVVDVLKSPNAPHRHELAGELCTTGNGISVKIKFLTRGLGLGLMNIEIPVWTGTDISKRRVYNDVSRQAFCLAKSIIYENEEVLGIKKEWKSDDVRQNTLWSYIWWMKATKTANEKARAFAKIARDDCRGGRDYARAWAMIARTCAEGIAYKWDTKIQDSKKELDEAAQRASELDPLDYFVTDVVANKYLYFGQISAAISRIERNAAAAYICPTTIFTLGLANSYRGEFDEAVKILERATAEAGYDPALAVGKYHKQDPALAVGNQYFAQALCLRGWYDRGLDVATRATMLNPTSSPAWRTRAVIHAFYGDMEWGREAFKQAENHSPGFTTSAYDDQPWQGPARSRMMNYIEKMWAIGVQRK